jgi:hypothetical protein
MHPATIVAARAFGAVFAAVLVGVYTLLGVMAGFGYEVWVEDRWRVLYTAGIVGGLRAVEVLLPYVSAWLRTGIDGRNGNGSRRGNGDRT